MNSETTPASNLTRPTALFRRLENAPAASDGAAGGKRACYLMRLVDGRMVSGALGVALCSAHAEAGALPVLPASTGTFKTQREWRE